MVRHREGDVPAVQEAHGVAAAAGRRALRGGAGAQRPARGGGSSRGSGRAPTEGSRQPPPSSEIQVNSMGRTFGFLRAGAASARCQTLPPPPDKMRAHPSPATMASRAASLTRIAASTLLSNSAVAAAMNGTILQQLPEAGLRLRHRRAPPLQLRRQQLHALEVRRRLCLRAQQLRDGKVCRLGADDSS